MVKWMKLTDLRGGHLYRGTVLRFPAKYPFEPIVDWMMVEKPSIESGFQMICSSGYKAGLHEMNFPVEAKAEEVRGISVDWIIENWERSVYPECCSEDVFVLENYPVPEEFPMPRSLEELGSVRGEVIPYSTKGKDTTGYRDIKTGSGFVSFIKSIFNKK